MDEKGSMSFFYVFIMLMFSLTLMFFIFFPFFQLWYAQIHISSQAIIADANTIIAQETNSVLKASMQAALGAESESVEGSIVILSFFTQYAWIWISLCVIVVLFMATRQIAEQSKYGGGMY